MATDLERLVVSLEASITKYEKTMARAVNVGNANAGKIEKRFAGLEKKLKNFGGDVFKSFAGGALSALAPILSVAAAVNTTKQALQEFGDIADNSKAAGLDAEFFQGLAYQAQLGGVAIDQLSGSLATFAKNSGLAVAGKGRMVTALKALNPELLENIRSATTQEQRIKLVADALSQEADASKRAAIATATFGDAGAKLADVFSGGGAQIGAMQQKAQELGLIVDRDLIARADELGDEFDTATKILDLQLKQALINLGPLLVWLAGLAGDLADVAGTIFDSFNSIGDRATKTLEVQLQGLKDSMSKPIGFGGTLQGTFDPSAVKAEIARIEAELFRRADRGSMTKLNGVRPPATSDVPTLDEIETRNQAAAAAVKQGEAVKALIADLQFEQQTLGLTAEQQQIMNALRQAGVEATSAEGQQITALIESINAQREAQEQLAETTQAYNDIAKQAGSALQQAFADGKLEAQELLDMLIKVVAQLALVQLGNLVPGGNLITSFLGGILGGFATGTSNTGGARGQVRGVVHGQEAVIPLPSGGKVPVDVRMPNLAGNGGAATGGVIEVRVSLDDDMLNVRIDNRAANVSASVTGAGVRSYDKALPGRMAEAQARHG